MTEATLRYMGFRKHYATGTVWDAWVDGSVYYSWLSIASPLACTAEPANPDMGGSVNFSATGGVGNYYWLTTTGTPSSIANKNFSTTFNTTGRHSATVYGCPIPYNGPVAPNCESITCQVEVAEPEVEIEVTVDGTVVNDLGSAPGFGNANIGSTTSAKSVRVTNIGTVPVVFRAGSEGAPSAGTPRTLGGWQNQNFQVNATPDTPELNTLAPGSSVEYATVAFSPVSRGVKSGILAIQYDRLGADFLTKVNRVSFTGNGTEAPNVTFKFKKTDGTLVDTLTVASGGSVKLYWTVTPTDAICTASDGWSGSKTTGPEEQTISNLTATKTFTLTCVDKDDSSLQDTKSLTVNVQGSVPGGHIREL